MATLQPAAARIDITWQAGDDRPAVIPVLAADGTPRDVTGWTVRASVVRSGQVVHTWSTTDGSATCGPSGVTLLADDSDTWAWRNGAFDVRVTSPGGLHEVVAHGEMTVRALRTAT